MFMTLVFQRLSGLGHCSQYNIRIRNNVYDTGISEAVWLRLLFSV